MKLLFIAGREPEYVRNAVLLAALRNNGVEIVDGTDSSPAYPTRLLRVMGKFLRHAGSDVDAVFVGFFGQALLPLVGRLTRKPILFDAFLSAYDTMCFDRKRFTPESLPGRFFYQIDKYSCERADRVLLDTNSYIDYFVETFGLPREKFRRVLVGADETVFYPRPRVGSREKFRVFYYASYLPLHGTEFVVRAAHLLRDRAEIEFVVVGKGPEHARVRALANELGVENVEFIDWLPYAELPLAIAAADVCLGGHFSDNAKAKRVIAGKTYQFIAMKRPVIVGDCSGNRELFADGVNAAFVQMASAEALRDGILRLHADPALRERIATGGYDTFTTQASIAVISRELGQILGEWSAAREQR